MIDGSLIQIIFSLLWTVLCISILVWGMDDHLEFYEIFCYSFIATLSLWAFIAGILFMP